jgi:hypothetical protein
MVGEAIIRRAVGEDLGDPRFWPASLRMPPLPLLLSTFQFFPVLCACLFPSLSCLSLYAALGCEHVAVPWEPAAGSVPVSAWPGVRPEKVTVAPKVTPKYAFLLLRLSLGVSWWPCKRLWVLGSRKPPFFLSELSAWLGVSSPVSWRLCVWVCELPPLPCRWPVAGGLISGVLAQL